MTITEKYVTVTGGGLHDGTSEADAWTFTEAIANAVAGDRVNVKIGTHSCTTGSTANGTYADPIYVRGYVSTIGDLDELPLGTMVGGTDMPLVQGADNNLGFTGKWVIINHIDFECSVIYKSVWKLGDNSLARSCRFSTSSVQAYVAITLGKSLLQDCYIYSASIYSTAVSGVSGTVIDCVIEGGGAADGGSNCRTVVNSLFKNFVLGLRPSNAERCAVIGCTFIDCTTAVEFYTYPYSAVASSCYFSGCTTAIKLTSAGTNNEANVLVNSCCYHNVTTQLSGIDFQYLASVDAADQFVDSAAGDYTLKATSNGYNAKKPNVLAGFGTVTKSDIGMIQHADAGGGGATHYDPFTNPRF